VLLKLEAVVSANLQRATRLRQSILHKAFTGQLVDLYDRKNPLTAQNKLGPPVT
jgi:hypothetical protein